MQFNFALFIVLVFAVQQSSPGCKTTHSTAMKEEVVSCTGYFVICEYFTSVEEITNSLDSQYGRWYTPNMWKLYCGFRFYCDFNRDSITAVKQFFAGAFMLQENIPLDILATLPSYDIGLAKCDQSHMSLIFNAYKYFKGIKVFSLSFIACNIMNFNLLDLITLNEIITISYERAPRLALLNLTGNLISSVSVGFSRNERLLCSFRSVVNVLDLNYNRITAEEGLLALCCTADLHELHLGYNSINKISTLITPCLADSLRLLNLASNAIESLNDFTLQELKNLEYLDLSSNKLSQITKSMFPKSLTHINLRNNYLLRMPDSDTVAWLQPIADISWTSITTLMSTLVSNQSTATPSVSSSTQSTEIDLMAIIVGCSVSGGTVIVLAILIVKCNVWKNYCKKIDASSNELPMYYIHTRNNENIFHVRRHYYMAKPTPFRQNRDKPSAPTRDNAAYEIRNNSSSFTRDNVAYEHRDNFSSPTRDNAVYEIRKNSSTPTRENAAYDNRDNSSLPTRGNAVCEYTDNSSSPTRDNAVYENRNNSSSLTRENVAYEHRDNSSLPTRDNAVYGNRDNSPLPTHDNTVYENKDNSSLSTIVFYEVESASDKASIAENYEEDDNTTRM